MMVTTDFSQNIQQHNQQTHDSQYKYSTNTSQIATLQKQLVVLE